MKFFYLFILLILVMTSCQKFSPNVNYIEINTYDSCYIQAFNIKTSNGFIINDKFIYYSGSLLQIKDKTYTNILKEIRYDSKEAIVDENGLILLNLRRLNTPFLIYKNKNS